MQHIGIMGGGAWGTALGHVITQAGRDVLLWARDVQTVAAINKRHENPSYLPDIPLHPSLKATTQIQDIKKAEAVLIVTPAQAVRDTCAQLKGILTPRTPLILCAKGIDQASGRLLSQLVKELLPSHPIAVLSGPSFASEVARGLPTAVTLACADAALGKQLVAALGSSLFRPYQSLDVIGAEVGGAVKNVLAIACGIIAGKQLGENAKAALITRGLAELTRLAEALGGKKETLMGLSGLGDLVLTCGSLQSRNMSFGYALGKGGSAPKKHKLAEGVFTAQAVVDLAARYKVDLPICTAVHRILHQKADIDSMVKELLTRPYQQE